MLGFSHVSEDEHWARDQRRLERPTRALHCVLDVASPVERGGGRNAECRSVN